jgi:hypothetical protein
MLRMRMVLWLLALDMLCIIASFWLAALLRDSFLDPSNWSFILIVILPIYVIAAGNARAYSASAVQDPFSAVAKGLQGFIIALSITIFSAFVLKTTDTFPRLTVSMGSFLAVVTLSISRYMFSRHLARIIGGNPFSIVLLRDGDVPIPAASFSIVMATDGLFNPESHDPIMYDRLATSPTES